MTNTEQLLREQEKMLGISFNVNESFTFSSGWMQKVKKALRREDFCAARRG
jgi:hypothetical protein